ncbi:MAG: hypothetical protein ABIN93_03705 [Ginsengibacter sp.]
MKKPFVILVVTIVVLAISVNFKHRMAGFLKLATSNFLFQK